MSSSLDKATRFGNDLKKRGLADDHLVKGMLDEMEGKMENI